MMSSTFDNIYSLLFHPYQRLAELCYRRYFWQALLILFLTSTLQTFIYIGYISPGKMNIFFALFTTWGVSFMLWLGLSVLLALAADLFGGKGSILDTMTASGLALTPLIFLAPVNSLPNLLGNIGHSLSVLGTIGIYFWYVVLLIIALKHTHQFSLDRSIASLILSIFLFLGFLTAGFILFMMQINLWAEALA